MAKSRRKRTPKTVLKLPDLEQSKSAVLNSLTSASSRRSYEHAIREFIEWYCSEPRLAFNSTVVTRYRIALEQHPYAASTINLRLAAIRRLAYEASDCGLLSPDLAAGIRRVKGVRRFGVRVGNWLTAEEAKKLLSTESRDSLRSCRNRALLALLIGCGLRRAEVTTLRFEDFQLREGHWVIADLRGKDGHIRTIPVPEWVKAAVDRWTLPGYLPVSHPPRIAGSACQLFPWRLMRAFKTALKYGLDNRRPDSVPLGIHMQAVPPEEFRAGFALRVQHGLVSVD
jgi:integrase